MNKIVFLFMFIGLTSCGQTPEEQKMIDEIKRKQDSMMNTPEMKEMKKNMKEQEKLYEAEKYKNKKEDKSDKKNNAANDWYWKNTIASENDRLNGWENGEADIMMVYRMNAGQQKLKTLKIGTINNDGDILVDLPENVQTQSELEERQNILFYDIQDQKSLNYTNGKAGIFANASLFVMKGEQQIGTLTLGNSERVTLNLVNQSALYSGDEGYLLYWAYVTEDCAIVANEDWSGDVRRDGTNTINVSTNVSYKLNFKKGWNLVKTEVIGNYPLKHERGIEMSWFKNHKHSIISSEPTDSRYYFRTYPNY
jgi:hypothetical protein